MRRTPVLVWVVYVLGILAATLVLVSALFTAGAYFSADNVAFGVDVSRLVVFAGIIALAVTTWLWRKSQARR